MKFPYSVYNKYFYFLISWEILIIAAAHITYLFCNVIITFHLPKKMIDQR